MIHANELRIGNKIYFSYRYKNETVQRVVEVMKLEEKQITVKDKGVALVLFKDESAQPIPLTPEILEKCGFETCSCGGYRLEREGRPLFHINKDLSFDSWGHINSLHQLQNLYFALTGTELTIEL